MQEALFYEKKEDQQLQCHLCPRNCLILEGKTGFCRVRKNTKGKLYSLVYAKPCSTHIDPVEKKPLYHFLPGSDTFSIGTVGCNLTCKHCQNWQISQAKPIDEEEVTPEQINEEAIKSCQSISYTYTEPTIFYEYVLATAKLTKLKNILVTNGYINSEPLKELCKYVDAVNVDLKAFSEEFYLKICSASLQPVLESLKIIQKAGVWLEITNLIIPSHNDDMKVFEKMCLWIQENLGQDVPLHISRFSPCFQLLDTEPTPEQTLIKAHQIAKKYLNHVYLGNLRVETEDNTYCPSCNELLIERKSFRILQNKIVNGVCCQCQQEIKGVWK